MIEIIPTWVPKDVQDLGAGADFVRGFADDIHVDIDDGVFAPHMTWPYIAAGRLGDISLAPLAGLNVEMHLMTEEPRELGILFAHAGARRIIGHIEGFADTSEAHGALDAWRHAGASEVGLGVLFDTPFETIAPLVPSCDVVHLMTIRSIGTQGIPYETGAPEHIGAFRRQFPEVRISVDGGVNESNIALLAHVGATRFGVGSALSRAKDPKVAYARLKEKAEEMLNLR